MRRVILTACLLALFGCDRGASRAEEAADAAADNTRKNARDLEQTALTPGDQGETEQDRSITQQLRYEIVTTEGLSMAAKNVKIITVDGRVTLRGPVKTAEEKNQIVSLAQRTQGVLQVDDQLEIAAK